MKTETELGNILYLTKDIEKYGSGYWRIRNYIATYPTIKFEYKEISGGLFAKLYYSEQKISLVKTVNVTKEVTKDKRLITVIELISQKSTITIDEIANRLLVNRRTIIRDLDFLQKNNKLKRIGGRKTGNWEVLE